MRRARHEGPGGRSLDAAAPASRFGGESSTDDRTLARGRLYETGCTASARHGAVPSPIRRGWRDTGGRHDHRSGSLGRRTSDRCRIGENTRSRPRKQRSIRLRGPDLRTMSVRLREVPGGDPATGTPIHAPSGGSRERASGRDRQGLQGVRRAGHLPQAPQREGRLAGGPWCGDPPSRAGEGGREARSHGPGRWSGGT